MITEQMILPLTRKAVSEKVVGMLAISLNVDPSAISTNQPLTDYGLDSLEAMVVAADMEEWLGVELPSTLLWDYKSVDEIVGYVIDNFSTNRSNEEVAAVS